MTAPHACTLPIGQVDSPALSMFLLDSQSLVFPVMFAAPFAFAPTRCFR